MIDLPVVLDDPTARRGAIGVSAGERSTGSDRALRSASATGVPWPWWMAPARLIGRIRPSVLAASASDAIELARVPRVVIAVALPLAVFVLCAIVSYSHGTAVGAHPSRQIEWLRLTIDHSYTESALFMLAAVVIGAFSPGLGVFFVLIFGVMDIVTAIPSSYELRPFPKALAGRLIAIWLLWLLAVEVPVLGRQLGLSWRRLSTNRFAVAALTALATGFLVWVWSQAAMVLIRPVFTWSSLPTGVTLDAVRAIQTAGLVFAVAGGVVAGIGALVRGPSGLLLEPEARPVPATPPGVTATVAGVLRRALVAALLTIGLGGLITWPLEAAVLFAVLFGAAPLARLVADRTPLGAIVGALPPIVRFAVAAVLSFGAAQLTIAPLYHFAAFDSSGRYPEFFSVVAAIAIGIVLVQLATTPGTGRGTPVSVRSTAGVTLMLGGTLVLIVLAAPVAVSADNCAGLNDCWGTPFLAALSGGALPLAALYGAGDILKYANRQLNAAKWDSTGATRAVAGVRG